MRQSGRGWREEALSSSRRRRWCRRRRRARRTRAGADRCAVPRARRRHRRHRAPRTGVLSASFACVWTGARRTLRTWRGGRRWGRASRSSTPAHSPRPSCRCSGRRARGARSCGWPACGSSVVPSSPTGRFSSRTPSTLGTVRSSMTSARTGGRAASPRPQLRARRRRMRPQRSPAATLSTIVPPTTRTTLARRSGARKCPGRRACLRRS
mmetsp:Transcript_5677/g.20345  ORF Transcript_5677/g.20345 Transcript_5677/m.20345 type:complete len:210 (+) Transcript_5677:98-727(+)